MVSAFFLGVLVRLVVGDGLSLVCGAERVPFGETLPRGSGGTARGDEGDAFDAHTGDVRVLVHVVVHHDGVGLLDDRFLVVQGGVRRSIA